MIYLERAEVLKKWFPDEAKKIDGLLSGDNSRDFLKKDKNKQVFNKRTINPGEIKKKT